MSLRFTDSFDHFATDQISAKWPTNFSGTGLTIVPGGGREAGGGALAMTAQNGTAARFLGTAESTWFVGVAVYWNGNTGITGGFSFQDSLNSYGTQWDVGINGDGSVFFTSAFGTATSASGVLVANAWSFIETTCVISSSGSYTVKVNGTSVLTGAGVNTQTTAGTTADTFALLAGVGTAAWPIFDDLYVCDANGSYNNTFLGNITVQPLWPQGAGTKQQWTPTPYANNFANVNDPVPDGDASVNLTGSTGNTDTFTHDLVRPSGATILGIQHCLYARTSTGTSHTIAAAEYTGGTEYDDAAQSLGSGYKVLCFPHDTDPATSAPFTEAGVNASEFGYHLAS